MALGRKTGGRQKGSKNLRTTELERATEAAAEVIKAVIPGAFDGDAHALLMAVYKDPAAELHARLDAAKAAIAYERPRLSSIRHVGDQDEPIVHMIVTGVERAGDPKGA